LSGAIVQNSEALGGGSFKPLERVQDVPTMRTEMKNYKRNFERGMSVKLSAHVENALWKEAKRLKDEFVIGMVSKRDMHPVKTKIISRSTRVWNETTMSWGATSGGSAASAVVCDYEKLKDSKAIERNTAWLKRNQPKVDKFKRIMRMLEPDNPEIANVERFRPER